MIKKIKENFLKKSILNKCLYISSAMLFSSVFMLIGLIIFWGSSSLKVNEYTLSNGEKTIIFQEMSHVAETEFYKEIGSRLEKYRKEGFKFAYEQVLVNTEEEAREISELTNMDTKIYDKLGQILELDNQSNHMGIVKEGDLNADISGEDLVMALKKVKGKEDNSLEGAQIINTLWTEDPSELRKYILKVLFRAAVIVSVSHADSVIDNGNYMQTVLLHSRNKVLHDKVKAFNANKLVIHYGAFHYKGFFELLKLEDPSWKVIKVEELVVF